MAVEWHGDEIARDLGAALTRGMRRGMQTARDRVVQKITRAQPRSVSGGRARGLEPSLPGEPPKLVTGRLRNAQTSKAERQGDTIIGAFGSNVEYQAYLELGTSRMAARPHLRPVLEENADEILGIIVDEARRERR